MNALLCDLGGAAALAWGFVHILPTRKVVAGFGTLSNDNRNIITMEWIAEGGFLMFIGALVIVVTAVDHTGGAARATYVASAAALIGLAIVSLFTGFKVNYLPYKLCPAIFTLSAVLLLTGALA